MSRLTSATASFVKGPYTMPGRTTKFEGNIYLVFCVKEYDDPEPQITPGHSQEFTAGASSYTVPTNAASHVHVRDLDVLEAETIGRTRTREGTIMQKDVVGTAVTAVANMCWNISGD